MNSPKSTTLTEEQWRKARRFRSHMRVAGHDCSDEFLRRTTEEYYETGADRIPELLSIRAARLNRSFDDVDEEWSHVRRAYVRSRPPREVIDQFFEADLPFLK